MKAGSDSLDPVQRSDANGRPAAEGTTARVVSVLDALAHSPEGGVGVRQLSVDLGVSRSAVHRILQSLADLGVARALSTGSYEAGPIMVSWAALLADRHTLLASAKQIMADVVRRAKETCYLFAYDPASPLLTLVLTLECDKPVRYVLEPGSTAPLHLGAAGKAVLMGFGDDRLAELSLDMSKRDAARFLTALKADLAVSRERGYAVSHGERIPEAVGVAAPFFIEGQPGGSLSITTPRYRMREEDIEDFGRSIRTAAADLSRLLEAPVNQG